MVEKNTDLKIKFLISDNGGDITSKEFTGFFGEHGIKRQLSATRTPQQNGVVERKNNTVQEMEKTMLKDSKLGDIVWAHEVHMESHILNKGMLISNNDMTRCHIWKGRPTNVKHF
jgi:transposase InsO family protein